MSKLRRKVAEFIVCGLAFAVLLAARDVCAQTIVPNEVVVKLNRAADLAAVAAQYNLSQTPIDQFGGTAIYRLRVLNGGNVAQIVQQLRADTNRVAYADPNYVVGAPNSSSVPWSLGGSWSIGGSIKGFGKQWMGTRINLAAAHQISKGTNVKVAVLDTGIDATHPLFAGRLLPGRDFVDNDNDPSEVGLPNVGAYGHGTHVAGIVLMVAPQAKIIPVRVLDENGVGNIWRLAQALNYAANPDGNPATDDGANVINLSLGTVERTTLVSNLLDAVGGPPNPRRHRGEFPNIEDANIVVTAAAGNTGDSTKIYPAAETVRGLLAVGASTNADTLATFSTRGNWIYLIAPGERIVSSIPGRRYAVWRGTSMAAPIAAGVAALVKAKYPQLEADQIIQKMRFGAVVVPNTMMRRIDAAGALQSNQPPPPTP